MGSRLWKLVLLLAITAAACGVEGATVVPTVAPAPIDASESTRPAVTSTTLVTDAPIGGAPVFDSELLPVTAEILSDSWHSGCPVALDELTLLKISYWDFAGERQLGSMVVHADVAHDVVRVFEVLFDQRFPIERMELVETYGGSDDNSMAANNSSSFNCRVVGGTNIWSQHAYGRAIDINPLINPYVVGSSVFPPEGANYLDREAGVIGMITHGDVVVEAFSDIGWIWGGTWVDKKDYQHFSLTGQ